jgi:hypothetical protein
MTALEHTLEGATMQRNYTAAELAADMRSMASRLDREAQLIEDALEIGMEPKSPNSIGLLQAQGSGIDARCGELAARNDTVAALRYVAEHAPRPDGPGGIGSMSAAQRERIIVKENKP